MKPHIRYVDAGAIQWCCISRGLPVVIGVGELPDDALRDWLQRKARFDAQLQRYEKLRDVDAAATELLNAACKIPTR